MEKYPGKLVFNRDYNDYPIICDNWFILRTHVQADEVAVINVLYLDTMIRKWGIRFSGILLIAVLRTYFVTIIVRSITIWSINKLDLSYDRNSHICEKTYLFLTQFIQTIHCSKK